MLRWQKTEIRPPAAWLDFLFMRISTVSHLRTIFTLGHQLKEQSLFGTTHFLADGKERLVETHNDSGRLLCLLGVAAFTPARGFRLKTNLTAEAEISRGGKRDCPTGEGSNSWEKGKPSIPLRGLLVAPPPPLAFPFQSTN